ncbi:MAG: DUF29 domain-containing protein [Candidatus Binatia bacterium]
MSTAATTSHVNAGLYNEDFYAWAMMTAALLRQRRFAELDIAHLAEELEDMGKRERRALESYIRNVTLHLLKWRYQPEKRGASWRQSIRNGRIEIRKLLRDSPSLAREVSQLLADEYAAARADAIDETELSEEIIPGQCPFTMEQVLDGKFWPNDVN